MVGDHPPFPVTGNGSFAHTAQAGQSFLADFRVQIARRAGSVSDRSSADLRHASNSGT